MSDQKQSSNGNNAQPSNDKKTELEQNVKDFTTKRIKFGDSAERVKKNNK
ncbi:MULTISPECIES: hypothetical protein [unclassified Arsenophonus]|nr:hypothetical protein [Arsenophonus sp.]MDR5611424.1 hypothetical protein [Arsenophonus sp.]